MTCKTSENEEEKRIKSNLEHYDRSYLKKYKERIDSGKIRVNKYCRYEINRLYRLIQQEDIIYDVDKINSVVDKVVSMFNFSNGNPAKFSLYQRVFFESLFAFQYITEVTVRDEEGNERTDEVVQRFFTSARWVMAKKSGKTEVVAFLKMICEFIIREKNMEIYCMSATTEQATILINACEVIINSNEKYKDNYDIYMAYPKKIIFVPLNSKMQVLVADKDSLQGHKPNVLIVDEEHLIKEDLRAAMDLATLAKDDPLIIVITTAGHMRDGMYDKHDKENDESMEQDDLYSREFVLRYVLEDVTDMEDEANWEIAMPNIGVSFTKERIYKQFKAAKTDVEAKRELITMMFGIKTADANAMFKLEHAEPQELPENIFNRFEDDANYCVVGIDLALTRDIASAAFLTWDGKKYYVKTLNVISSSSYDHMSESRASFYRELVRAGHLEEFDGEIDLSLFADRVLTELEELDLKPLFFATDPWHSGEFMEKIKKKKGKKIQKIIKQRPGTMSEPIKRLYRDFEEGRVVFDCPVLSNAIKNVIAVTDKNGSVMPDKKKSDYKIDSFMSFFDAYICFMFDVEPKYKSKFVDEEEEDEGEKN